MDRARERLSALQERLRQLICARDGVAAALAGEGDAEGAGLAALLRGDARASARERLEVYANAYFARLLEALREDYPALAAALGDDSFHDLATAYLLAHPPTRPSLRDAGAFVRAFLAGDSGEAAYFRLRWPWAADLARLEWALVDAFDAPDAPLLSRAQLAAREPGAWDELTLRLHPATAVLGLDWPVQRLREDHERGALGADPGLEREPTLLCVTRRDERVRYRPLEDPLEAALLPALARAGEGGLPFGALCLRIAELRGEDTAPSLAAALLSRWVEAGALAA